MYYSYNIVVGRVMFLFYKYKNYQLVVSVDKNDFILACILHHEIITCFNELI